MPVYILPPFISVVIIIGIMFIVSGILTLVNFFKVRTDNVIRVAHAISGVASLTSGCLLNGIIIFEILLKNNPNLFIPVALILLTILVIILTTVRVVRKSNWVKKNGKFFAIANTYYGNKPILR